MHRAALARTISFLALAALFSTPIVPAVVHAQNICILANNECEHVGQACACPVAAGLFTIVGVCVAPDECQYTGVIPTGITSLGMAAGGGTAGAGMLLSSLFSSSQQSETNPLLSTAWNPSLNTTYGASTFSTGTSPGFERLDSLIGSLGGPQTSSFTFASHAGASTAPTLQLLETSHI